MVHRTKPLNPVSVPSRSSVDVTFVRPADFDSGWRLRKGFWPGGGDIKGAAFYAYAAPEPPGFAEASVRPASAFYHPQMHEFILMYDDVRQSASPNTTLLDFLQSTYEAGANSAKWNRAELERAA